jgi:predicted dehydrogenase
MSQLKIVQVGLGSHGTGVGVNAIVFSPDFEYVGLVDPYQPGLEEAARQLNVDSSKLYNDHKRAFAEADADAVYISAISPVHYEVCKDALESGLHVLIEKPFVLDINEGKELVELAEKKNLKLMVDQNYRYNLHVRDLIKLVQEKKLGELEFANVQFYYFHDGKPYQKEMENYMLMEMAIHHADLIRYVLGSNVKTVNGKTWNEKNSGYNGDPCVHAAFEMESGIPVFYTGTLLSKGLSTSWEGKWRIQCKNGSIHLDDLGQGYGVYVADEHENVTRVPLEWTDYADVKKVFAEFASSIREDREPAISGRDNLLTLATQLATNKSSKENRQVAISEIL